MIDIGKNINKSCRMAKKHVSISEPPWRGDHGTETPAAINGTILVEVEGPNHVARRQRMDRIDWLLKRKIITQRQYQAAARIRDAYARVEMLSSGSPLAERVQSSPKPDSTIAAQIDAISELRYVMEPIGKKHRALVETVCWNDGPLGHQGREFRAAMDLAADWFRY